MSSRSGASLPPDGGWGWMVVFGTFMAHFIFDGVFYSFGILFAEFVDYFHTSQSETSLIDSLAMGSHFLMGPFASILTNKFGSRIITIIGSLVLASGFILTFFTPNLYFMYFSLGILPGLGYGMIYLPSIVMLNQYFEKRRAFAVGIAVSGAGIGTFAFSPLIKTLINIYSWKGTMLILSGVTLNCAVCGALFRPLTKLRKNTNPTAVSGKSSKSDDTTVDPEKLRPDHACNDNTPIAFPNGRKVLGLHSDEISTGITVDDVDKVYTISLENYNTSSAQGYHFACQKKEGTPVDRFDGYSETIPMDDMKKQYNTSLCSRNMSAARQEVVPEHRESQQYANKKEIDKGFKKFTRKSNNVQDEDIYTPGADAMLQPIKVLRSATSDQSNRNHSNQIGQSLFISSCKPYVNAVEQDNHHYMDEDNRHLALPLQVLKSNQTFDGEKESNDDELEHRAKCSVSQVLEEDKVNEGTSVSPLDNAETHTNNHEEPLVLCRCLALSAKHSEELRSVFQHSIMKNKIFVIFIVSHMLYAFGYYIPYVYLPVYAEFIGIDLDLAAWIISALGIASTVSRVISGFLSDLPNVNRLHLYSAALVICGAASTLVPLCDSFPLLMAYACILGVFSGVTLTLISVLLVDLLGMDILSEAFGIINLVEGVTSLAGPPLAAAEFLHFQLEKRKCSDSTIKSYMEALSKTLKFSEDPATDAYSNMADLRTTKTSVSLANALMESCFAGVVVYSIHLLLKPSILHKRFCKICQIFGGRIDIVFIPDKIHLVISVLVNEMCLYDNIVKKTSVFQDVNRAGGWLFDHTRSYTTSFIMTGIAIAVSGLTLLIIPCVQKRGKKREE